MKLQVTSFCIKFTRCKLRVKIELQLSKKTVKPNFETADC